MVIYEGINGTELGQDLSYIFVYANSVTQNLFGLLMTISFFLVILLGSFFMQLRFSSKIRSEISVLASSFATLGFAIILQQTSGILNAWYFVFLVALLIISFIWVAMSSH